MEYSYNRGILHGCTKRCKISEKLQTSNDQWKINFLTFQDYTFWKKFQLLDKLYHHM